MGKENVLANSEMQKENCGICMKILRMIWEYETKT